MGPIAAVPLFEGFWPIAFVVGIYGFLYWQVARDPERGAPIAAISTEPQLTPLFRAATELCVVTFRYRGAERDAVRDVTLDVQAGRCTAVLGPNGSGKSTLLRILGTTIIADSGEAAQIQGQPRTGAAVLDGVLAMAPSGRDGGWFGPEMTVPADASAFERALAASGHLGPIR